MIYIFVKAKLKKDYFFLLFDVFILIMFCLCQFLCVDLLKKTERTINEQHSYWISLSWRCVNKYLLTKQIFLKM